MEVVELKLSDIYTDEDFNCRGKIFPTDVTELAKNIEINGLIQPISVRPALHHEKHGCKYEVIAGFRRTTAFRALGRETIPAVVHETISDSDARIFNLSENTSRQDLNILQEAKAIRLILENGVSEYELAKRIGQSRGWVQVRKFLLLLDEKIQEAAASGLVTQPQIREFYGMPEEERETYLKKVIAHKENKKKGKPRPKEDPKKKRLRDQGDMYKLQDLIYKYEGHNILTRVLAWACGLISDEELYKDLEDWSPNFIRPDGAISELEEIV